VNLTSQLQGDYGRDFSQGGELKQLQGEKDADLGTSLQTTQGDEQSFESILDPSFVQTQSAQCTSTMSNAAMQDSGSGKAVVSALKNGGTADTTEIAQSIAAIDPDQLYGGAPTGLTAGDTQALVSSFLEQLDTGSSVQDACAKFDPGSSHFDDNACDGSIMAKLQSNPAAAQGVQMMLQGMAAGALGVQAPADPTGGGAPASSATATSASGTSGADPTATASAYATADEVVPDASGIAGGTNNAVPAAGGETGGAAQAASTMAGSSSGTPDAAVVTARPGMSAAETAKEDAMYAGMGIGAAGMLSMPAGYLNTQYWNRQGAASGNEAATTGRDVNASRISMAGEVAGGVGGVIGAATMLPDVSAMLKNGETAQAGLAIGMSTRGIIQGGALAANLGDMAARKAGMTGTAVETFDRSWSGKAGQWAVQNEAKDIGGRWAGNIVSRTTARAAGALVDKVVPQRAGTIGAEAGIRSAQAASEAGGKAAGEAGGRIAGEVAGRAVGMAAAEAVGAAVPVVGWIADAAMGIGMIGELIAQAVKKAHEKKEMAHTVNPTLKQYGIPEV
ncbi:MAG: hypothetical protein ACRYG8_41290, partial [Janthinobacterium lividum]